MSDDGAIPAAIERILGNPDYYLGIPHSLRLFPGRSYERTLCIESINEIDTAFDGDEIWEIETDEALIEVFIDEDPYVRYGYHSDSVTTRIVKDAEVIRDV